MDIYNKMATTNLRHFANVLTILIVCISCQHYARADFQRSHDSRYAFMELGRFDDCGVDSNPVDTGYVETRVQCGLRCLREATCLSYDYNDVNRTCNLHSTGALENLVPKFGFTYGDGYQPNKGAIHPCDFSPCNTGQICTEECAPHGYTCECPEGFEGDNCDGLAPVDGGFTDWSNRTICSEACMQTSYRNCTEPEPVGAGNPCFGPNTRTEPCLSTCNVHPYIGCLRSSNFDAEWEVEFVYQGNDNSIDYCVELCAAGSYQYAAMAKTRCRCIRDMEQPDPALFKEDSCRRHCPGNVQQTCGHQYYTYWSIYAAVTTGNTYRGCFSGDIRNGSILIANFPTMAPPITTMPTTVQPIMITEPEPLTFDLCNNVTLCSEELICTNGSSNCANETVCVTESVCQYELCYVTVDQGNGTVMANGTEMSNGTMANGTMSDGTDSSNVITGMIVNGTCVLNADGMPCSTVVNDWNMGGDVEMPPGVISENGTVSANETASLNETTSLNGTAFGNGTTFDNGTILDNGTVFDNATFSMNSTIYDGVLLNGTCILDGTPCSASVNGSNVTLSGAIRNGNCVLDGTRCLTDLDLLGEMDSGDCIELPLTTTDTPTTFQPTTTVQQSTLAPYPGLHVTECVEGCLARDYQFAGLWNGTTCTCFNTLADLQIEYDEGACDVPCPGGDIGGPYCGGDVANTVYELDILGMTYWTPNFNMDDPSIDGDDIEQAENIPWICEKPLDIQCTLADSNADYATSGDVLNSPCTLEGGLNCTAAAQVSWENVTYTFTDYRMMQTTVMVNQTVLQCVVSETMIVVNATDLSDCVNTTDVANATNVGNGCQTNETLVCIEGVLGCVNGSGVMLASENETLCSNVTVQGIDTVMVNTSFVNTGWYMNASATPSCADYQVSYQCGREHGKLMGCHVRGDVNGSITNTLGSLDITTCGDHCSSLGYRLFAMSKQTSECACGNNMGVNEVALSSCIHVCGAANEPCGGNGLESVYTAVCNLPLGITKQQMSGSLYHYNEALDDYGLWFYPLNDNPTVRLDNFTNVGLHWEVVVDLGSVKTISKIVTTGLYISRMNAMSGVTAFRMGTKLYANQPIDFYATSTQAMVFTVADISAETTHTLPKLASARYVYIFVDQYTHFPGLKFELYGCNT